MNHQPAEHPALPIDLSAPAALPQGLSRRELLERSMLGLVMAGAAASLLAGCASGSKASASSDLKPMWPIDQPAAGRSSTTASAPQPMPKYQAPNNPALPGSVIPRSAWAKGSPLIARMNKADRPYSWITVHHDGMDAFTDTSYNGAARRLEQIRQAHLTRKPEAFGDIGYHYVIDPAGRIWQGRDTYYQGAHVAGMNPGNLGICVLGNYEYQRPNPAQTAAINWFVASQMRQYGVTMAHVRVHREWPSAQTLCPGKHLWTYMKIARANPVGGIAAA